MASSNMDSAFDKMFEKLPFCFFFPFFSFRVCKVSTGETDLTAPLWKHLKLTSAEYQQKEEEEKSEADIESKLHKKPHLSTFKANLSLK